MYGVTPLQKLMMLNTNRGRGRKSGIFPTKGNVQNFVYITRNFPDCPQLIFYSRGAAFLARCIGGGVGCPSPHLARYVVPLLQKLMMLVEVSASVPFTDEQLWTAKGINGKLPKWCQYYLPFSIDGTVHRGEKKKCRGWKCVKVWWKLLGGVGRDINDSLPQPCSPGPAQMASMTSEEMDSLNRNLYSTQLLWYP